MMSRFRRIIAAEYEDGHLFSLTMETLCGSWTTFDFEWSHRYGAWYQESGSGPARRSFNLGNLAQRPETPWLFYLAPGLRCKGGRWMTRITEPLELDPFADASEGGVTYCEVCDDHLPEDVLCEHLAWCDHCEDFTLRFEIESERWRLGCAPCRERLGLQLIELDQQLAATPPLEQAALSEQVRHLRTRYAENEGRD